MTEHKDDDRGRAIAEFPHTSHEAGDYLSRHGDTILKALSAQPREDSLEAWQPIESAPRDGTRVCLWDEEYKTRGTGYYFKGGDGSEGWISAPFPEDNHGSLYRPTHWQPLPAPPAALESVKEGGG